MPLVYCRIRKDRQTFDVDQFSLKDIQKKKICPHKNMTDIKDHMDYMTND